MFLSPDTIVPTSTQGTQAWDRYAFVNNNPIRYSDPSGHNPCEEYDEDGNCLSELDVSLAQFDEWEQQIILNLMQAGSEGKHVAEYIMENNVQIEFKHLTYGGGGWGLDGNITLDSSFQSKSPDDAFMVGLIAHEAYHLEQGAELALSKVGEIEAWKLGFTVERKFSHSPLGTTAAAIADLDMGEVYRNPQKGIDLIHTYNTVDVQDPTYNFMFNLLPTYPIFLIFLGV